MRAKFSVDRLQSDAFMGYLDGLSTSISSRRYMGSVLDYTYSTLSERFGESMDAAARLSPKNYHHVYEWGDAYGDTSTVGNPAFRLWQLESIGKGNRRTIGFTFLPSVRPSPINPILLEPGENGQTVLEGVHVFTWKAPIMEYGITVTISPQLTDYLAFVMDDEIVFTQKTIHAVPGKGGSIGSFTGFFMRWFGGGAAQKIFDLDIRPELERDVSNETALSSVLSKYRRRKGVNVNLASYSAFADGKAAAEKDFKIKSGKYIAEAAERRFDIYGY